MLLRLSSANTFCDSRYPSKLGCCRTKQPLLETLHVITDISHLLVQFQIWQFFVIEPEHRGNCRLLASVCHLYFKFRWISLLQESNFGNHEATASQVKNKLKEAVRNCNFDATNNNAHPDLSSEDDFFKNMDSSFSSDSKNNLELLNYLKDTSKSINSLDKYPIQKIFKKYNTTLPFSAPVERLFSFASLVHSPNELVFQK